MTNSNLRTFDNFYSNLAQSAYRGRPNLFAYERLTKEEIKVLDSGKALEYDFSRDNKLKKNGKSPPEVKIFLMVEKSIYSQILVCIL